MRAAASGRTLTRYAPDASPPGVVRSSSRTAARSRRRTRLRTTAGPDPAADGVGDTDVGAPGQECDRHRPAPRPAPVTPQRVERRTVADPPDQAERRCAALPAPGSQDRSAGPGPHAVRGSRAASPACGCSADTCASPCASSATRPPRSSRGQRRGKNQLDDARRQRTRVGAGTTLEPCAPVLPTRLPDGTRAARGPVAAGGHPHVPPAARSPPCGRPLVGAGHRCYVASTPTLGPGCQSRGRARADRRGGGSPTPAGYLASRACAVIHMCGWCCG